MFIDYKKIMKKFLILIILGIILVLMCSCNNREDVSHTSQEDVIKYASKIIGEPIEFVSKSGEESDDHITYTFKLIQRNIEFYINSDISAVFVDGTRFSNYKEELYTNYEEYLYWNPLSINSIDYEIVNSNVSSISQ